MCVDLTAISLSNPINVTNYSSVKLFFALLVNITKNLLIDTAYVSIH
ncbi:hypothetical protein rpr22_0385 [Rickettsia prowazekii str. Rp22]|uniref:Uncharacterized protein n=1 Tax=Rickettsia prowazekii (strain Rp22) TaxID=449216 RepID=D5AWU9_RICPP|nr:hypothetical protein rpr22_0385 [Rickettsia prowazekii str. Rp22]